LTKKSPTRAPNRRWYVQISDFRPISHYISNSMHGSNMVTIEH